MRNLTIFAGLNPTCCIVCRLYSMGLLLVKHPLDTHIHPPPVAGHQARWTSRGSAGWGAAWFGYTSLGYILSWCWWWWWLLLPQRHYSKHHQEYQSINHIYIHIHIYIYIYIHIYYIILYYIILYYIILYVIICYYIICYYMLLYVIICYYMLLYDMLL